MKSLDFKLLLSIKRIVKNIRAISRDFFATFGFYIAIAEAFSEIFNYQGVFKFINSNFLIILIATILYCVCKNWDKLEYTVKIANFPDISITLKVCDALKNKGAIIIPTNSTFDTEMSDEFISKESVQGQYQIRFFNGKLDYLNRKLEVGLEGKKFILLNDNRKYNKKRYPIGTISRVNMNNKRAYFLASSDIGPKGIPLDVDASVVNRALISLWEELSKEGNSEHYSIPLLGTGKARAKNVSRDEIVQQIILSFLAASKEHKITERLTICIHPSDFEKVKWDDLCEFLKFQSQYANKKYEAAKLYGTEEIVIAIENDNSLTNRKENKNAFNKTESKRYNITPRDDMITTILANNKMTLKEIAETTGMSIYGTSKIVNDLLNRKVLTREVKTDNYRKTNIYTLKTNRKQK